MIISENEKDWLVGEIEGLLEEYGYGYTRKAIEKIVRKWAEQKATLIEAFKKHPNYVEGQFMIAFCSDFERDIDVREAQKQARWIRMLVDVMDDTLPEDVKLQMKEQGVKLLPYGLYEWFEDLTYSWTQTKIISEGEVDRLKEVAPWSHPHYGEKRSRVVNRICKYLGYDKHPEYNRNFAKYADALSPIKVKRHTILSINPMDYLTMSFGNSWASCHTIDKENRRQMPNSYEGQYSSGTVSYMLDGSSMVLYLVDSSYSGEFYYTQPKINRQMFHWGEEKLVQGRLYPQSNDTNVDAYEPYRKVVQKIMSEIFDFPNLWTMTKGAEAASRYIATYGTHYEDYEHFSTCTLSRIKGSENEASFAVGEDPICVECGCEHSCRENINCCEGNYRTCEHCGARIPEDEEYWVGDYAYCRDCVTRCECCDEYVLNDDITEVNGANVCRDCLEEDYIECAECGEYVHVDDATYIEGEYIDVCPDCRDEHFRECPVCFEYHRTEDMYEDEPGTYVCERCHTIGEAC